LRKNLLLVAIAGCTVVARFRASRWMREKVSKQPYLSIGLHIIPEYRGQGIGSRMLNFAINWAKQRGFKKLDGGYLYH